MSKPNLFILGAPKCGTTAMADWLAEHPNVFVSPIKEPHFFSTDLDGRHIEDLDAYEALFSSAREGHAVVAEASVWYLYSQDAVANILRYSPTARFVVMLRNPAEMAYSLHQQLRFSSEETIGTFPEAWRAQDARRGRELIPPLCRDARQLLYGEVCKLGEQVQRLLELVPRERVVFVFMEDLRKNPRAEYLRVLKHVAVPDDGRRVFDPVNAAKARRFPALASSIEVVRRIRRKLKIPDFGTPLFRLIDEKNRVDSARRALPGEFERELRDYFSKDVALLGHLLDRDLTHWTRK